MYPSYSVVLMGQPLASPLSILSATPPGTGRFPVSERSHLILPKTAGEKESYYNYTTTFACIASPMMINRAI